MKSIGIFGGTFDPVHYGHLRPALELLEDLKLDEVRLIPARQPPHRDEPVASPQDRLAMLETVVEDVPGFVVDRREMDRSGPSYMVDTLTSLRKDFPDTAICLLLGMDAFLGLDTWHRWQEIPDLAHIVVSHRPGSELNIPLAINQMIQERVVDVADRMRHQTKGLILFHPVTQLDISATRIRALYREGKSSRFLLPDSVREYIEVKNLYR